MFDRIAVLGGGSWGVALANAIIHSGHEVILWMRDAKAAGILARKGQSPHLPGIAIDSRIDITSSLPEAAEADVILLVVPAQATREVALKLSDKIADNTPLIACAKGIERGSRKFMTEVIAECAPRARPAILSGPSFAADVVRGLPTAVTLAAAEESLAAELAQAIGTTTFRPYHSTDLRGVEIGGAAKNVFAIAAGVVEGRGLGASAAAALITRAFAELMRFGKALQARPETLTGLSGLGDLILTCSSLQSRNFSLGHALGRGMTAAEALQSGKLAEGAYTASVLLEMARAHDIDMPIVASVAAILDGSLSVDDAITGLLARPIRSELA